MFWKPLGFVILLSFVATPKAHSQNLWSEPSWEEGFQVPEGGRWNPYQADEAEFLKLRQQGRIHAQIYPVTITGALPPYRPFKMMVESEKRNLRGGLSWLFRQLTGVQDFNELTAWMGLQEYPSEMDRGIYSVPYPENKRPEHRLGFGVIRRRETEGFTFSCAACHASNLFGKTVLGMSNRFPRANEVFVGGKMGMHLIPPEIFRKYTKATPEEVRLLTDLQRNIKAVGVKKPLEIGLDTSLAQVALSLNRRNPDDVASKSSYYEKKPRPDLLDHFSADSKPPAWWNVKYKNRWLSDGSVVSGNPIFTNIIWNEIGRGTDLEVLESWLAENHHIVQELTTAVFSSQAPRVTDFFSEEKIDLARAKNGEVIYMNRCSKCHGEYTKKWSEPGAEFLPLKEQFVTTQVRYKQKIKDVGTDANRYKGMKSLEKLNDLRISKSNGVVIRAQEGYVPPPLVGIWARWPYMHNNSIPNLCALLTRAEKRPSRFYQGEALHTERDFDFDCNGYPLGSKTPNEWRKKSQEFDARREGMRNTGHDEGIFLKGGEELLTSSEKSDLIQFLQTL